ncbi:MAG: hypothetical protein EA412_06350 [Chitinophagaceae bacterium]|nr:MAG: hypothetical protein EA412_06350 [Chitinophagaceae bacterium]
MFIGLLFIFAETYFPAFMNAGKYVGTSESGIFVVAFLSLSFLFAAHYVSERLLKRFSTKRTIDLHLDDYYNSRLIIYVISTIVIIANIYLLKSTQSYWYLLFCIPAVLLIVKNVPSRDGMAAALKKANIKTND